MRADQEHLKRLRDTHQRRKSELEVKAAQLGIDTPPEVALEIDQITQTLRALDAKPFLTPQAAEVFTWHDVLDRVLRIEDKLDDRLDGLGMLEANVTFLLHMRIVIIAAFSVSLLLSVTAFLLMTIHVMLTP